MVLLKFENLADHLKLVTTLNEKFAEQKSKDNHARRAAPPAQVRAAPRRAAPAPQVFMFIKEFLKTNEARFAPAELNDLIIMLTNQKKAKEQLEAKPTESNKTKKNKKKSKKEQAQEQRKHADLFGESAAGEYDAYEDQYDDFF